MLPKIDVVVCVYNEIEFLDRCMNSLLNQTYDNYSIILVDDGSNDGSEDRCDNYAKEYDNVKAIHQNNSGLSIARNVGVRVSDADFIVFVDADDYVISEFIEYLQYAMASESADMATISIACVGDEKRETKKIRISEKDIVNMDTQQALKNMCYKKYFGVSACAKLIRKELLLEFSFPEGELYEDLSTIYKIVGECSKVSHVNCVGYYYTQHYGKGITRGNYSEKNLIAIKAARELKEYLGKRYPCIEMCGEFWVSQSSYNITKTLTKFSLDNYRTYKKINIVLRESFWRNGVYKDKNASFRNRVQIGLGTLGFFSMILSWHLYYFLLNKRKI